jgi:hypothetical protein
VGRLPAAALLAPLSAITAYVVCERRRYQSGRGTRFVPSVRGDRTRAGMGPAGSPRADHYAPRSLSLRSDSVLARRRELTPRQGHPRIVSPRLPRSEVPGARGLGTRPATCQPPFYTASFRARMAAGTSPRSRALRTIVALEEARRNARNASPGWRYLRRETSGTQFQHGYPHFHPRLDRSRAHGWTKRVPRNSALGCHRRTLDIRHASLREPLLAVLAVKSRTHRSAITARRRRPDGGSPYQARQAMC